MKYKIKTKNSFFELYKDDIFITAIILFVFVMGLGFLCLGLYYPCETALITIGMLIVFLIYKAYAFTTFLLRQGKIPLTKEELEILNIKSIKDYEAFLYKYLKGFNINNKTIKIMCSKSAFYYLLNDKERLTLLTKVTGLEYKINDVRYKEIMEKEKSITYSVKGYNVDEIDLLIYKVIDSL